MVIGKYAAPHSVEQHVGEVMGRAQVVARELQSISAGDDSDQVGAAPFDIVVEP